MVIHHTPAMPKVILWKGFETAGITSNDVQKHRLVKHKSEAAAAAVVVVVVVVGGGSLWSSEQ